jgi:tight adherence protein C
MNATSYVAPALCNAVAIATTLLLFTRTLKRHGTVGTAGTRLPLVFALSRWPALVLAPTLSGFLSAGHERRVLRVLDANGLYPQLTPALWLASRLVHGMAAATAALMLAGKGFWIAATLAGIAGFTMGGIWLRRLNLARERAISRELPAYLDLLTVCVEAGATLTAGARLIVAQAPESPLRSYFERVLREVRSGRPRAEAFAHVAEIHGVESLTTLASALAHAEGAGMSLGQILRAQSEQRTAERFARAERLAMQAPVKMLGPLIFCIFPCTFIVLAVPIVVRMLEVFRS